jgi:acetoin utilization protein AcuB
MSDPELQAEITQLLAENRRLQGMIDALVAEVDAVSRVRVVLRETGQCHLCVRDIMTPNPQTVRTGDSLRTAVDRFRNGGFRRLPVLDEVGRLVGIVTDRDLRLAFNSPLVMHERWQDEMLLDKVTIDVCMTPEPITTTPDTPVWQVARTLREKKIGGLPVLNEASKLVGIISEIDLLRAFEDALTAAAKQQS